MAIPGGKAATSQPPWPATAPAPHSRGPRGGRLATAALRAARTALLGLAAGAAPACTDALDAGGVPQAVTVSDVQDIGCSTSVVRGLSLQILDEVACSAPGQLVLVPEGNGIVFTGPTVFPYVSADGRDDLLAAVAEQGGTLLVNSVFRTPPQQYLLWSWHGRGLCEVVASADPGRSNHESGRAVDIDNFAEWETVMAAHGWLRNVPGDDVHFEHLASPDLRGEDVLAFQRLWNRNVPDDPVAADGIYGAETERRMLAAPAEGFALPACAGFDAALEAIAAPHTLAPGQTAAVSIQLRNTGTATWTAARTQLATAEPDDRPSPLEAPEWAAPTRPAYLVADARPGELGRFDLVVRAPDTPGRALAESFALVDGEARFSPPGGIVLELEVSTDLGDGDGAGHGGGVDDGPDGGGCAVAGGSAAGRAGGALPLAAALLLLGARGRRGRRTRAPAHA